MGDLSKVVIVVGTDDIDEQIANYTEVGVDKAPAISYKGRGLFFRKRGVLNLVTDVTEMRIVGPEHSSELAKYENIIKGMNIARPFGLVGALIGSAIGRAVPPPADRATLMCKLHKGSVLIMLVEKQLASSLSKRFESKMVQNN